MKPVRRTTLTTFKTQAMGIMVIAMLVLAALQVSPAHAATILSTPAGGNWNLGSTWAGGIVPGAGDSVTIVSGATVTVTANASAGALTFGTDSNASSLVTINPGITLSITNAVTIPTGLTSATNTLAVGAGTLTAGRISFTNGGAASGHVVTISTGTVTVSGNIVGTSGNTSPTITFTDAGLLQIGGSVFTASNGTLNTFAGSTVEYNGNGVQTVGNFNYSNLILSGSGAKTFPTGANVGNDLTLSGTAAVSATSSKAIGHNLTIGAGASYATPSSSTATLAVSGTTSVSGSLLLYNTAAKTFTGNVVINSGGVWSEQAAAAFTFGGSLQNDGSFTASTGLHTFGGTLATISGANPVAIPSVKVNGTLTNNGVLTVATALSGTGALTNGAGATLNIGAPSITPTLTANAAGNIVSYNSTAQTVDSTAYDILVLRGSGVKSILAGTSVATNLSIAPVGSASASIAAGANLPVGTLLLGGALQAPGTWGGTGSGATNINTTYFAATTGKLTVAGKSVNVTADPQSKTYGDADPVFTYVPSNLSVTFTGSLGRVSGEHAGHYAITIGTLSAGFYAINFTSANLTINQKALTAGTADDKFIAPGDSVPPLTVTYSGLVGSDTFASIDTPPSCSVIGDPSSPGDYPIHCTDGSGSDLDYDLSGVHYTDGTLHVTNAAFGASPSSFNYGFVKVGVTSATKDFLILNIGSATMDINTVGLVGVNANQFQITADNCTGATLAASSFCKVSVAFKPTTAGTKSAAIQFTDTGAGSPHSVPLTGRATAEVALNGGFNQYPNSTTKVPTGWAASLFSTLDGKNTLIKEEGTASIKITNTSVVSKTLTQTRSLSGAKGGAFILSLWIKGQAVPTTGPAVQAVVTLYNGSTLVKRFILALPNGTYGFVQRKLSFVAPGAYNNVSIQLSYGKSSGSVWFDGLSLLRAP